MREERARGARAARALQLKQLPHISAPRRSTKRSVMSANSKSKTGLGVFVSSASSAPMGSPVSGSSVRSPVV